MKSTRGFTLIELMVTLAVLVILLGLGVPSFRAFIGSQKVKSGTYELMTTLVLTRSEAVKRNANALITPTSASDWSGGWRVNVTGAVLHRQEAISGLTVTTYTDSTCTTAGTVANILYTSAGRSTASSCLKFTAPNTTNTRCVKVDLTGIPSSGSC